MTKNIMSLIIEESGLRLQKSSRRFTSKLLPKRPFFMAVFAADRANHNSIIVSKENKNICVLGLVLLILCINDWLKSFKLAEIQTFQTYMETSMINSKERRISMIKDSFKWIRAVITFKMAFWYCLASTKSIVILCSIWKINSLSKNGFDNVSTKSTSNTW